MKLSLLIKLIKYIKFIYIIHIKKVRYILSFYKLDNNQNFSLEHILKINSNIWELKKSYNKNMIVPGKLFLSNQLFSLIEKKALDQISNVASLPGIIGSSIAMPDVHVGYGFTIGGVAAFDENEGVIVPGGVGFDINCGVRLIRTNLKLNDFLKNKDTILKKLFLEIPSGVGEEGNFNVKDNDLNDILTYGSHWAIEKGYGIEKDVLFCEENGCMNNNNINLISKKAYKRGKFQLGTLGSGNHFLEIQYINKIYDKKIASNYGLFENQICVMIHCGSRGLGHQICTDYINKFNSINSKYNINIQDKELTCVPIYSKEGEDYFQSMSCGANYAWVNRQIITYKVRKVFEEVYKKDIDNLGMNLVYDVSHNIVKREKHCVNDKYKYLFVHRKGATRSFPPFHKDIPNQYLKSGQPVLIPGSMGTSSYILSGSKKSMDLTFGSSCHGSGRLIGRSDAIKMIDSNSVLKELSNKNISIKSNSLSSISSEAPNVYKSSDEVVNVMDNLNIACKVAKLTPIGVIKG